MTGRERLVAAARGGETDRQAVIAWRTDAPSDAVVVPSPAEVQEDTERAVLVEVINPFGRAQAQGVDLNALLSENPGAPEMESAVTETRDALQAALATGADGVLYRVHGARAKWCTPMQFGGWYLERDRELLSEVAEARLNVVYVVGEDDTYLDFVSDLPAHLFAWDSESTGTSVTEVRTMRQGALASQDSESEVFLAAPGRMATLLEG